MSRGPVAFKQTDVARALRAAKSAGVRAKVEIDPKTGKITIIEADAAEPAAGGDTWAGVS